MHLCIFFIMDYLKTFKEYIKELRLEQNLTQVELAKELNISQATIARLEAGINAPDVLTLIAYATYFRISTDKLLGLDNYF